MLFATDKRAIFFVRNIVEMFKFERNHILRHFQQYNCKKLSENHKAQNKNQPYLCSTKTKKQMLQ